MTFHQAELEEKQRIAKSFLAERNGIIERNFVCKICGCLGLGSDENGKLFCSHCKKEIACPEKDTKNSAELALLLAEFDARNPTE